MIVRDAGDVFVMVAQHDHAQLSGDVAKHFANWYFVDDGYRADVVTAIYEHDRGWIRLDDAPIWNDRTSSPFTFMDYPLLSKLTHYTLGIDETERMSGYAALLCSRHYSALLARFADGQPEIAEFLAQELARQKRISDQIVMPPEDTVRRHFGLLQLCDDISLYACLNEPGASKREEHPWYADGFGVSASLTPAGEGKLMAAWTNGGDIRMTPMPFRRSFAAKLRQKRVPKQLVEREGLQEAFRRTDWMEQELYFTGG